MTLPSFTYDGIQFDGEWHGAVKWSPQYGKVSGWFSGAGIRANRVDRPGVDGTFPTHTQRAGRTVVIGGKTFCRDHVSMLEAMRQLRAVSQSGRLLGASDLGELAADVSLDDQPFADPVAPEIFEFQLTLHAPDPTLYGRESFTSLTLPQFTAGGGWQWPMSWPVDWGTPDEGSASVFLPNDGTATYWPRLRLSGELVNPTLSLDTGEWLRFNGSLAADQWLDIDLPNRRVLLNRQASRRQFVTTSYGSSWLGVPPGGARMSWAADNTNSTARFSVWAYQGAWA